MTYADCRAQAFSLKSGPAQRSLGGCGSETARAGQEAALLRGLLLYQARAFVVTSCPDFVANPRYAGIQWTQRGEKGSRSGLGEAL